MGFEMWISEHIRKYKKDINIYILEAKWISIQEKFMKNRYEQIWWNNVHQTIGL